MSSVRVLFFAAARDAAGVEETAVSWDGDAPLKQDEFWQLLEVRFPAVLPLRPGLRLAKNLEYVTQSEPLFSGDEVGLIPPVSGG